MSKSKVIITTVIVALLLAGGVGLTLKIRSDNR